MSSPAERCPCGKIAYVKNITWDENKSPCLECYEKLVEEWKEKNKSTK